MVRRGSTVRVRQRASHKKPANGHVVLPAEARLRVFAGTRRVHFGTGGHSRARATCRDAARDVLQTVDRDGCCREEAVRSDSVGQLQSSARSAGSGNGLEGKGPAESVTGAGWPPRLTAVSQPWVLGRTRTRTDRASGHLGHRRPGGERSRVEAFDDQPYRQNHFLQGQRDEQDIGQGGVGIPRP